MITPTILFDDRRMELFPVIVEEMARQGIVHYNWAAPIFDGRPVVSSINVSQKEIVRQAKVRGDKECCIMEQDIWFPANDGWRYFLANKPKEYDCYIGGSYLIDNRVEYKPQLVKVNEWVGNHCILIHERYYDTFLATDETKHIDSEQSGKGEFYLCYPMAALQRPSKSANNMMEPVNYNTILKAANIEVHGAEIHNL